MANTSKGVTVKILGKDYQVSCAEEQTHNLIDASLLLDSKLREIRASGRVIGLERMAVMAALNLAHELRVLQLKMQHHTEDTERRLQQMHSKLEDALSS